jgi:hypothetical protein
MPTEVRGVIVEALVGSPLAGIGATGIIVEALVSSPLAGIGSSGMIVEALVGTIDPPPPVVPGGNRTVPQQPNTGTVGVDRNVLNAATLRTVPAATLQSTRTVPIEDE